MIQSNYSVTTNPTSVTKKFSQISIVGKKLAESREKAGLTQDDLGKLLEVNRVTVARWEGSEIVTLSEPQINIIKKALSVTTEALQKQATADILDHPVIKSLVSQSEYIMTRVKELEEENRRLRGSK
jgi:transcriptional regulator with XRE-family HTH domain